MYDLQTLERINKRDTITDYHSSPVKELIDALKRFPLEVFNKPMADMDAADFVDYAGEFVQAMNNARIVLEKVQHA